MKKQITGTVAACIVWMLIMGGCAQPQGAIGDHNGSGVSGSNQTDFVLAVKYQYIVGQDPVYKVLPDSVSGSDTEFFPPELAEAVFVALASPVRETNPVFKKVAWEISGDMLANPVYSNGDKSAASKNNADHCALALGASGSSVLKVRNASGEVSLTVRAPTAFYLTDTTENTILSPITVQLRPSGSGSVGGYGVYAHNRESDALEALSWSLTDSGNIVSDIKYSGGQETQSNATGALLSFNKEGNCVLTAKNAGGETVSVRITVVKGQS